MDRLSYDTVKVLFQDTVCFLQIDRPQASNTINGPLIEECLQVLDACEEHATIVVLTSSTQEVFCFGADFKELRAMSPSGETYGSGPGLLYDLWLKLATGPYVTVAQVRGKVNAGGVGFVAASDIVLADETAQFSLSELLFGLYPACVLPFLIRRIGFQKTHYMTLMTQPVGVEQACEWGLVDAYGAQSDTLLRKHLLRLRYLSKTAIRRYKSYVSELGGPLRGAKAAALAGNSEVFSDPKNVAGIARYMDTGVFPWET